jgi:uncharacterized protein (DUF302 family)
VADIAVAPGGSEGVVTKPCRGSVADVVARAEALIDELGLTRFAEIDHSGEAARAGLSLRDTEVVIFGSPRAGTPLMVARPLLALDLPLKVLVWQDDDGSVWVSYLAPDVLADRHGLDDDLRAPLRAIEAFTDRIVG